MALTLLKLAYSESELEAMMNLQNELDYFITHQEELVNRYQDKVLVIKDRHVVGVYDSPLEAYLEAQKSYELGTFMIQPCEPGPSAYTVTISHIEHFPR